MLRVATFGAFVEIFPGTDGLLHISEIDENRIRNVRDVLQEGDQVRVVNLPGCPRANTMGHAHVQRLDGSFAGLVLTASLDSVQEYRAYLQRKIAAMESAQVQK